MVHAGFIAVLVIAVCAWAGWQLVEWHRSRRQDAMEDLAQPLLPREQIAEGRQLVVAQFDGSEPFDLLLFAACQLARTGQKDLAQQALGLAASSQPSRATP